MTDHGFSELECKIIKDQIARRAKYRCEFMKQKSDPCKHSQEAGYVFDKAIQHFVSTKTCQYDYFRPTPRTIFGALLTVIPMFVYGGIIWTQRNDMEQQYRCGIIKYRDRMFKLQ